MGMPLRFNPLLLVFLLFGCDNQMDVRSQITKQCVPIYEDTSICNLKPKQLFNFDWSRGYLIGMGTDPLVVQSTGNEGVVWTDTTAQIAFMSENGDLVKLLKFGFTDAQKILIEGNLTEFTKDSILLIKICKSCDKYIFAGIQ